jgi:hypothetical protein
MGKDSSDMRDAVFSAGDAVIGAGVLIFIGVVAGNWLDSHFHTSPWGVVSLSLIGAGLGLWRMVRKAMHMGQGGAASSDPLAQPLSGGNVSSSSTTSAGNSPSTLSDSKGSAASSDAPAEKRRPPDAGARSAFDFLDQGDSQ